MVSPAGTRPVQTKETLAPFGAISISYETKQRSWQKAPFNLPLTYYRLNGTYNRQPMNGNVYGSDWYTAKTLPLYRYDATLMAQATNKAYETFKGNTYDNAQLGVDFVEYRQTLDIVAEVSLTLGKAALQVKRGQFLAAAYTLKLYVVPKGVSLRKSFASNWLRYHFGWEPLYQDVHDSLEVLNNPIKSFESIRGRGSNRDVYSLVNDGTASVKTTMYAFSKYGCSQGGRIEAITNVGLHSLDQFGVLNPAAIAWELVPFSFVVDWYANVGQVLSSFSDFAGMSLVETYTSYKYTVSSYGLNFRNVAVVPLPDGKENLQFWGTGSYMFRGVGLTSPTFSVKRLRMPSKVRALTATSLLLQIFGR